MMNTNKNYQKAPQERKFYNDAPRPRHDDNQYEKIPYYAIERRYVTEFLKEMMYLSDKGIRPVQVIVKREWGIRQYKYVKTPELFAALHEFWQQEAGEREFRRVDRDIDRATRPPRWIEDGTSVKPVH